MLAPPVSRAGVSKQRSTHRMITEKRENAAAGDATRNQLQMQMEREFMSPASAAAHSSTAPSLVSSSGSLVATSSSTSSSSSIADSSPYAAVANGGVIKVQPRSTTGTGNGGASSSSGGNGLPNSATSYTSTRSTRESLPTILPLHLRQAQDLTYRTYPYSLMFYDSACEIDYLKCIGEKTPKHVLRVMAMLLVMFAIQLGFEAHELHNTLTSKDPSKSSSEAQRIYLVRVILISIAIFLTLLFGLTSRFTIPYQPRPQLLMVTLLSSIGAIWSVSSVIYNDRILDYQTEVRTTESSSLIVFLLILHGGGRFLFFHLSLIPSGIATLLYIILSSYYASSEETHLRIAYHCLLSGGSLFLCWYINYRLELLKRINHINSLKVILSRRAALDLKKEAFDLRDEMYVMTLERYDIVDVDKKELEFKSPMEQAMGKLQGLSDNKSLPKDAFLEIQKIIGLLGNSSDVFRVQVANQLADKHIQLDDETTRYLFDLVNNSGIGEIWNAPPVHGSDTLMQNAMNNDLSPTTLNGGGSESQDGTTPSVGGGINGMIAAAGSGVNGLEINPQHRVSGDSNFSNPNAANTPNHASDIGFGGMMREREGFFSSSEQPLSLQPEKIDETTQFERMISNKQLNGTGVVASTTSPSGGIILAKEERQINELLKSMDSWNFDVFEVANLTAGKPLFFVGTALFKKYNLIQKFRIDRVKLSNFLNVIENGYLKTNPYHNSVHASDVARTVHYFLHTSMRGYTSDLEILGLIVASLIHDYDHPGRTNQFAVATRDYKAILYNDRAVLECLAEGTIICTNDLQREKIRVEDLTQADVTKQLHLVGQSGPVQLLSLRHHVVSHTKYLVRDADGREYAVTPNHRVTLVWGCDPIWTHLEPDGSDTLPRWRVSIYARQATAQHAMCEKVDIELRYWPTELPLPVAHDAQEKQTLITPSIHRGTKGTARATLLTLIQQLSLHKGDVIDMPAEELWARLETEFRADTDVPSASDYVYAAVSSNDTKICMADTIKPTNLANEHGIQMVKLHSVVQYVRGDTAEDDVIESEKNADMLATTSKLRTTSWKQPHPLRPTIREPGTERYRFVSIEVSGNHRYQLGNGTLTHNSHHVAQAFFQVNKDENNIFAELSPKDYTQIRKIIVELVLATDLGAHFDFLAQFKSSVSSGSLDSSLEKMSGSTPTAIANRLMVHKMALKCGDLGHSSKSLNLHEKWTHRITEEFYRQGDEERKRNIPISPFMDRQRANLPQSQVGFLGFLVTPLMTAFTDFLGPSIATDIIMKQLNQNREHWKSQIEVVNEHLLPIGRSNTITGDHRHTITERAGAGGESHRHSVVDHRHTVTDRSGFLHSSTHLPPITTHHSNSSAAVAAASSSSSASVMMSQSLPSPSIHPHALVTNGSSHSSASSHPHTGTHSSTSPATVHEERKEASNSIDIDDEEAIPPPPPRASVVTR